MMQRPFITAGMPVPEGFGSDLETVEEFDALVDRLFPAPPPPQPRVDAARLVLVRHLGVEWIALPAVGSGDPIPLLPVVGDVATAKRTAIAAIKSVFAV